jgi:hypothetical protein
MRGTIPDRVLRRSGKSRLAVRKVRAPHHVVDADDLSQANSHGSYWKLSSVGDLRGDPMTTIDKDDASLEAALSLREIAACYRKFAAEAGNPTVWEARLR